MRKSMGGAFVEYSIACLESWGGIWMGLVCVGWMDLIIPPAEIFKFILFFVDWLLGVWQRWIKSLTDVAFSLCCFGSSWWLGWSWIQSIRHGIVLSLVYGWWKLRAFTCFSFYTYLFSEPWLLWCRDLGLRKLSLFARIVVYWYFMFYLKHSRLYWFQHLVR